jgi:Flp pilus assembly protein TadG
MLIRRSSPKTSRLCRNRRGAAAALFLVMTVALLGVMAVTIDVTRLMAIRAELQTAADAAALAGVIELLNDGGDTSRDTAIAYGLRNTAETDAVVIAPEDVTFGTWDPYTSTFTELPGAAGADAMAVIARKQVGNWFAWALNILDAGAGVRAIAWAEAPIDETNECVKPWAIPEDMLEMDGIEGISQNDVDMAIALRKQFILKSASGQTAVDLYAESGFPSFFYPVILPPSFKCGTNGVERCEAGEYHDVSGGANVYRTNIATCNNDLVGYQDSLTVEPGNMPGPTVQGARDFCPRIDGTYCLNDDGTIGVPMVAAFWNKDDNPIGRTTVEVARMGCFNLREVYPEGSHGVIIGEIVKCQSPGEVGTQATNLFKPILVR